MKDIKEYLEKQLVLSEELSVILKQQIDLEEEKEKEKQKLETQKLHQSSESNNNLQNINCGVDRIAVLRNKLGEMSYNPKVLSNSSFVTRVYDLHVQLTGVTNDLDRLEEKINTYYEESFLLEDKINNKKNMDIQNKYRDSTASSNITEPVLEKSDVNDSLTGTSTSINSNLNSNLNLNEDEEEKKLEFKFGTKILNIIGVVLILISLITFGKYVYTNYMNNFIKGISLFVISSGILYSGEKVFKKKLPKFATGICALGVGGLYSSLMINYLVLNTINSTVALILTVVITGISLYISYGNNSNIVRIIALLGAYICLYPMNYLNGITSYVTVIILITISAANSFLPIKNKTFLIYSSVIDVIFCSLIISTGFLEEPALKMYLLAMLSVNCFAYIRLLEDDTNEYYYLSAMLSTILFVAFTVLKGDLLTRIVCVLILGVSYHFAKGKLKNMNFVIAGATTVSLLMLYRQDLGILFTVLYICVLAGTVMYQVKKGTDEILKVYTAGLILYAVVYFIIGSILETIMYGITFGAIIWFLANKYKNNVYLVASKTIYFTLIIYIILFVKKPFIVQYDIILALFVTSIYLLLNNNIDRLRHDKIKESNLLITISGFVLCNINVFSDVYSCIISLVFGAGFITILTSEKYIDNKSVLKNKHISYSLYLTFAVCILFSKGGINTTISNLLLSIILMIIALLNVWLGFKVNNIGLRRYGLVLSLIVCGKLLLLDLISFNFAVKTVLFLVIGVIALAISYIYTKLENDLKNRK